MATESIQVSVELPVDAQRLFDAWMNSAQHTLMTGGKAVVDPKAGGRFSAWDGYISGETIEIGPGKRVYQAWRTTEFPAKSPDSKLEVLFEESKKGHTRITLKHSEIPKGDGKKYQGGWEQFYFAPMKAFFAPSKKAEKPAKKSAPKKTAAKKSAPKKTAASAASSKKTVAKAPKAKAPAKKVAAPPKAAPKKSAAKKAAPKKVSAPSKAPAAQPAAAQKASKPAAKKAAPPKASKPSKKS